MDKAFLRLRRYLQHRRYEVKRIHKSWVGFGTGLSAVLSDLFIVAQLSLIIALYGLACWYAPIFWYVCMGLTAVSIVYVLIYEPDLQSRISWTVLFVLSCGLGFFIYALSRKAVCYGIHRLKFSKISKKAEPLVGEFQVRKCSPEVKADCEYLYRAGGFVPYSNTDLKYYPYAKAAMDNIIARIDAAEKFVFMEFFILADGVFLDRLVSVFRRKVAEGVEVRLMYDDVGSAGVLSSSAKKRIKLTGVKLKTFSRLASPFYFGLNYRDHRKIVVVDGKTGYVGGFNMIDDCANQRKMEGIWKDSGLRLDGAAVDGLSLTFMRHWEFATNEKLDYTKYIDNYDRSLNKSTVVPYAGGPEIKEPICRNLYMRVIEKASKKLYIMSPYLVPDSVMTKALKDKAKAGVDVRLILPGVPDYRYLYRVTQANAIKLIKSGVKVYYSSGEFVHSKVMLTEHCAVVGSVNLDMRAFYQEFDNGVYSDDKTLIEAVEKDFDEVFARGGQTTNTKQNWFSAVIAAFLKLLSPLM
ncbi:MAG: hypothetical protein K2O28_06185 [Clostridia bacterium]|nr:hypothetical protein [Clostridia bacterium]